MKPIKLELQAFGPFVEKQVVDFERLGRDGIFLVKGPTGSGKTTIFDAMTFALFGGGSGEDAKQKNGRNDLKEWRCTQALPDTVTYVSFTFEAHGHKYVFKRSVEMKRVNLSESCSAGELMPDGVIVPFFENPKEKLLNEKAEELIGLTKDQFRKVVLLPQGQFERFLVASSEEKEQILKAIFSADQWARYAQAFFDAAKARTDDIDEKKRRITASLGEEQLASLDALTERIASLKKDREDAQKAHEAFDGAKKQEQLGADRELAGQFGELHRLEREARDLAEKKEEIDKKRDRHSAASSAEALRQLLGAYDQAQASLKTRKDELEKAEKQLPDKRTEEAEAKAAREACESKSPVEGINRQIGEYESKRAAYREIESLRGDQKAAQTAFEAARRSDETAAKALENAQKAAANAKRSFDEADKAARNARNRYYAGIYGEIASELRDGHPCPVCGSVSHPAPARRSPDSVSKADVDRLEGAVEKARRNWDDAEKSRETAEKKKDETADILRQALEARTQANAKVEAAESQLIEGVATASVLEEKIRACRNQIDTYEKRLELLRAAEKSASEAVAKAAEALENAGTELDTAKKAFESAERALSQGLIDQGFADAGFARAALMPQQARDSLHGEIERYEQSVKTNTEQLEKKRRELDGKTKPDADAFEERQREITEETKAFAGKDAEYDSEIKRLTKKHKSLSEIDDFVQANAAEAADDLSFAKSLRGDTGIGLQRYVLAIMFQQVIGEANRMLEHVHGGRYRLFRTDDKGKGNKRGLELRAHDSRSPEKDGRSVSMLSGGEKFLVSLALSIGMSTVAQQAGVQIEALFIDEGFGTLDGDSIQDALDVLDHVRRGRGTIGIISHVQLLADNIPTQVEVVKTEAGSRIAVK